MHIDLAVIMAVLVSALLGYRSGAVQQLSHWIGIVAALILTKPASTLAAPAVASLMGWPLAQTVGGLRYAMVPVIFLAVGLVSRLLLNLIEPGEERGPIDQALGVAVGFVRGAMFSFAFLCLLVPIEKALTQRGANLGGSKFYALARAHNLFTSEKPGLQAVEKEIDSRLERGGAVAEAVRKTGIRARVGR